MLKLESKMKLYKCINIVRYSNIDIDTHLSDYVNLPVSACDQVTRSGTWVVVDVAVVVVRLVVLNFGIDVVIEWDTNDTVVNVGFFFWGGVGLVPVDVMIVGCAEDANLVGVVCVAPKKSILV